MTDNALTITRDDDATLAPILAQHTNKMTLKQAARGINNAFELAAKADTQAFDARINAGKLLIEAKGKVEAAKKEHGTFAVWCAANIKRSMPDIYRVMKLVGSDNPQAAREAEKAAAKERMTRKRAADAAATSANVRTLETINKATPKPIASVWDKAASGLPASAARDLDISTRATVLAKKSGSELASHVETEIRLLADVAWATISDARRGEIARLLKKMLERVQPATN